MKYIGSARLANGEVLLPSDVERELVECVEQLERGTDRLRALMEEQADAALDLDVAMARAMLKSKERSEGMRKAEALDINEDLHRRVAKLNAQVTLAKAAQHDLRASMDVLRSVGASVRASMWEGQGTGGSNRGGGQHR